MALEDKYPIGLRDGQSGVSHAIFKPQEGGNTAVSGATTYTVPTNTRLLRIVTTTAGVVNFPDQGDTSGTPGTTDGCYFPVGVEYMHVEPGMVIGVASGYVGQFCAME